MLTLFIYTPTKPEVLLKICLSVTNAHVHISQKGRAKILFSYI